ncbi:MAG: hypothetical protein ACQKBV_04655 [Puniceicoccales bacterium]
MKSTSKLVIATAALGAAALITGCSSSSDSTHELYSEHNQGFNALGIVDWSPASYEHVPEYSMTMHSDEALDHKNISGDNLSLFWGTIVFADY